MGKSLWFPVRRFSHESRQPIDIPHGFPTRSPQPSPKPPELRAQQGFNQALDNCALPTKLQELYPGGTNLVGEIGGFHYEWDFMGYYWNLMG